MDNGLDRCYSVMDLPEVQNADYMRVVPHRGEPERWGFWRGCWADNVCLTAYNPTEFLLYHDCDTFEEYIAESGLDMTSDIKDLEDSDATIRKFIEDPQRTQIWELTVDYGTNYLDSYWIAGEIIRTISDVYHYLREGMAIRCHDYRSHWLCSDELDCCLADLELIDDDTESGRLYECYFSKDELKQRIQSRINELEKSLGKED